MGHGWRAGGAPGPCVPWAAAVGVVGLWWLQVCSWQLPPAGGAPRPDLRAGLDILRHPIHGSGNPVPWDTERGAEHREFLGMLHVKRGDYAHWAVRIDRAARRVTHVSAGPVLKNTDYRNEVRRAACRRAERARCARACMRSGCLHGVKWNEAGRVQAAMGRGVGKRCW